jgi:hypothetical protein
MDGSGPAMEWMNIVRINDDGFAKLPISMLRFISLPLRRTLSTPHGTRLARLELSLWGRSPKAGDPNFLLCRLNLALFTSSSMIMEKTSWLYL